MPMLNPRPNPRCVQNKKKLQSPIPLAMFLMTAPEGVITTILLNKYKAELNALCRSIRRLSNVCSTEYFRQEYAKKFPDRGVSFFKDKPKVIDNGADSRGFHHIKMNDEECTIDVKIDDNSIQNLVIGVISHPKFSLTLTRMAKSGIFIPFKGITIKGIGKRNISHTINDGSPNYISNNTASYIGSALKLLNNKFLNNAEIFKGRNLTHCIIYKRLQIRLLDMVTSDLQEEGYLQIFPN
jgi:hypothetical protein